MFVLKILVIVLGGGLIPAQHQVKFVTLAECTAFAPVEIERIGKKLNAKWPGTEVMGSCEPEIVEREPGEPI